MPVNRTWVRPDIAAIDYLPYGDIQGAPFIPSGKNPIRRLQYGKTQYLDGPAGEIFEARKGHRHKLWGSRTPAGRVGRVLAVNATVTVDMGPRDHHYKMCCLNRLSLPGIKGDSGALVAYASSEHDKRYVAGVAIAADDVSPGTSWYIPASDIKTAFENANKSFSYYWGTRSGYRKPANTATDDESDENEEGGEE